MVISIGHSGKGIIMEIILSLMIARSYSGRGGEDRQSTGNFKAVKLFCMVDTLYICQNPQNIHHQE